MMIQVFVHQGGPLCGSEGAEEAVWVGRTARRSGRGKAIDDAGQSGPFHFEIPFIIDDKTRYGWRIAAHGLFFTKCHALDHGPEDAAH